MKNLEENQAYQRAQKRVESIKSFYTHFLVYVVINLLISGFKIGRNLNEGESINEAFFDFSTYMVWIFWGVGIAIHAVSVFILPYILGNNWEEKKISEYMQKEQETKWE